MEKSSGKETTAEGRRKRRSIRASSELCVTRLLHARRWLGPRRKRAAAPGLAELAVAVAATEARDTMAHVTKMGLGGGGGSSTLRV